MRINRILVIDDQSCNVASAHQTLGGFEVTVVDTISAAYKLLESGAKFDLVLTDLWMPRGDFKGAMSIGDEPSTPVPAGLVFALKAANDGMRVIICSDQDHHKDRLCSLLDLIKARPGDDMGKMVMFVQADTCPVQGLWKDGQIVMDEDWWQTPGPRIKDWSRAIMMAGIEVEK